MRLNTGTTLLWAALIAGYMVLGTWTLFVGLVVIFPLLGHGPGTHSGLSWRSTASDLRMAPGDKLPVFGFGYGKAYRTKLKVSFKYQDKE